MTRILRPLAAFIACGTLLAGAHVAFAQQSKIAYVDMRRVLSETNEGKAMKIELKKEFNKKQAMLNQRQDELKHLKDELDKKASVMDPAKRKAKQSELEQKFLELQHTYTTLQQQLTQREQELTEKILGKVSGILSQIARENGVDIIFEKSAGILWAKDSLDVTNELIRKFNAKYGHGKHKGSHKTSARKK